MKNDTLILVAAAAVAAYLVKKAGGVSQAVKYVQDAATRTTEILNSAGKNFGNGYRYFSDGTVIDPFGRYWKNNQIIWSPPTLKSNTSTDAAPASDPTFNTWI